MSDTINDPELKAMSRVLSVVGRDANGTPETPIGESLRRLAMFSIDMIRQDTNHLDKRRRHHGRASCEVAGRRFEAQGPAPIYKLVTLLWLHGHGGADFEVWDDVSPFGKPGGLAMTGRVRSWAYLVREQPNFTRKAQPDPDFTPDERQVIAQAAGTVIDLDETRPASGLPGAVCVTRPADGPEYPQERDRAPAALVIAPRRKVA